MSRNLPSGWAFAQIPDLIGIHGVFVDGDWVESKDQDPKGDVRLIQLADVGDGHYVNKSNRFLTKSKAEELRCTFLKKGDVLVARMPDPLGRACIFPGDHKRAVTVVDVCVIRGKPTHIDHSWLMHFINAPALRMEIDALQSGSTRKRISRGNLSAIQLPVPPRNEQTRIVEKLEELLSDLDAGVAELKAAQRKLAQYRQSLLKAAVEGALTADWRAARHDYNNPPQSSSPRKRGSIGFARQGVMDSRFRGSASQQRKLVNDGKEETGADLLQRILTERRARWETKQLAKFAQQGKTPPKGWQAKYPEPAASDTIDPHRLPHGWAWATVGQLSLEQRYGSSAKTDESTDGVPVLRMGNIQDGELELSRLKYLPQEHHEFPDLFLEDGELLFNRTNSPELVGKAAVYRSQVTPCSYASYLISVKLSPRCLPEFVAAYINSVHGRHWIKSVVTQQVGQANVNGTKLAALAVPLPPEDEQREIVKQLLDQLGSATEQAAEIERSLMQSAAQRKNILKAAFAGQLVPQDPNDEPASVLLERIRTERDNPRHPSTRSRHTKLPKRPAEPNA